MSHTSTALFRGDHLISAKSSGELICLEASTGKQVWESAKVTDLKNGASIHLTENGDSVLLYTDKGELIRARLTAQGYKEISRVALLEPTMPFVGSDRIHAVGARSDPMNRVTTNPHRGPEGHLVSSDLRQPSYLCPQQQRTDLRLLGGEAMNREQ